MKRIDIIRRAGRSLRQAKARTLLTSLAIGVGAFTLTISLAAGEGARQYTDKLISSNIDPQALFIVKDKNLFQQGGGPSNSGLKEYDPDAFTTNGGTVIKRLTNDDIKKLQARDDLTAIRPIYQLDITYLKIQGFDKKYSAGADVYNPDVRSEIAAGNLPALGDDLGQDQVVVPDSFATALNVDPNTLVGKTLTVTVSKPVSLPSQDQIAQIIAAQGPAGIAQLGTRETKDVPLKIRAVIKGSATSLNVSTSLQVSGDQAKALTDYTDQGTDNYQKYIGVTAKAAEGKKPEDVKAALDKAGYPSQTAKDLQNLLFTIVNILQGIVAGFGILALIASVFGIINTQYISVLERTQQIGLMKALGMPRRDVAKLFRYEAAWIGFLGGVIGAGVATLAGTLMNPWVTKQLDLGEGNSLLVFQPLPIIALILVLMLIAIIAGYFPARKAAKLDPIEALRTE